MAVFLVIDKYRLLYWLRESKAATGVKHQVTMIKKASISANEKDY